MKLLCGRAAMEAALRWSKKREELISERMLKETQPPTVASENGKNPATDKPVAEQTQTGSQTEAHTAPIVAQGAGQEKL